MAATLEAATARGAKLHAVPDAVVARLQQFAAMNAFKREARRVLATFLPEEEVREQSGLWAVRGQGGLRAVGKLSAVD